MKLKLKIAMGTFIVCVAACGQIRFGRGDLQSDLKKSLLDELVDVPCVKAVEPESVVSLGTGSTSSVMTSHWNVLVKDGIATKACADKIHASIEGVKILKTLDTVGIITVAGKKQPPSKKLKRPDNKKINFWADFYRNSPMFF